MDQYFSDMQYKLLLFSYVQFSNIAARCVRAALKAEPAVAAEKRAIISIKFHKWEAGKPIGKQYIDFLLFLPGIQAHFLLIDSE